MLLVIKTQVLYTVSWYSYDTEGERVRFCTTQNQVSYTHAHAYAHTYIHTHKWHASSKTVFTKQGWWLWVILTFLEASEGVKNCFRAQERGLHTSQQSWPWWLGTGELAWGHEHRRAGHTPQVGSVGKLPPKAQKWVSWTLPSVAAAPGRALPREHCRAGPGVWAQPKRCEHKLAGSVSCWL